MNILCATDLLPICRAERCARSGGGGEVAHRSSRRRPNLLFRQEREVPADVSVEPIVRGRLQRAGACTLSQL